MCIVQGTAVQDARKVPKESHIINSAVTNEHCCLPQQQGCHKVYFGIKGGNCPPFESTYTSNQIYGNVSTLLWGMEPSTLAGLLQYYTTSLQHVLLCISVPSILFLFITHICSAFLMKRKVMGPPWLIERIEMQSADRLVIESGRNANAVRLELPSALDEGMRKRDAQRGDKKEWRRRKEIYSVIETVMGFVRSTCQGQVKMALVREEKRDERMGEKGPIGVRILLGRGPRPCQPYLIANLCQSKCIKR